MTSDLERCRPGRRMAEFMIIFFSSGLSSAAAPWMADEGSVHRKSLPIRSALFPPRKSGFFFTSLNARRSIFGEPMLPESSSPSLAWAKLPVRRVTLSWELSEYSSGIASKVADPRRLLVGEGRARLSGLDMRRPVPGSGAWSRCRSSMRDPDCRRWSASDCTSCGEPRDPAGRSGRLGDPDLVGVDDSSAAICAPRRGPGDSSMLPPSGEAHSTLRLSELMSPRGEFCVDVDVRRLWDSSGVTRSSRRVPTLRLPPSSARAVTGGLGGRTVDSSNRPTEMARERPCGFSLGSGSGDGMPEMSSPLSMSMSCGDIFASRRLTLENDFLWDFCGPAPLPTPSAFISRFTATASGVSCAKKLFV
mmetsp:Transcript_36025/g.90388  ORF Transcript_36025/g.90388 Transcript_36025/m.90388 type:complete len:362 (+) Transcript_36025:115-1200(+)